MDADPPSPAGPSEGQREATRGLSVVLPALDLEGTIGTTVEVLDEELRPLVPRLEFIVVDDGSSDGTAAAVQRLRPAMPHVRLLRNRRNLGKGMAVYAGLLAAAYDAVCFTDGDLPFSAGSYARVVRPVLAGCPFVAASRRLPDSEILVRVEVLRYTARRHLVGLAFNRAVRVGLGLPFRDTQCGLKAFDRRIALELFRRVRSARFLFDVELFLAARQLRVAVEEVPVCVKYDTLRSSVKIAADGARTVSGLLMIGLRDRLGRYRDPNPAMEADVVRALVEEVRPLPVARSASLV